MINNRQNKDIDGWFFQTKYQLPGDYMRSLEPKKRGRKNKYKRGAYSRMSDEEKDLIVKYFNEGKTGAWIAEKLGREEATISNYKKKIRSKLKQLKFICDECGKEYEPIRITPGRNRFCGQICGSRYNQREYIAKRREERNKKK